MKLYYSPIACSMSPHIVLQESGLPFSLVKVDLSTKKTDSGADYNTICPKSQVPALEMQNGEILTEGPAIVQYIADLVPEKKLAPAAGTTERYRLQELLNTICSEIHKNFGQLFPATTPAEYKPVLIQNIVKRYAFIETQMKGDFLLGADFTVADAYLFTTMNWAKFANIDLTQWPKLSAFQQRVAARPSVAAVMKAEGLA